MKVVDTPLPDVLVIEPKVFGDSRGFFLEAYNQRAMAEIGIREHFVQDNHSFSAKNVLRGLHYQLQNPQGKLVRVVAGEILDVVVDLRRRSASYGKWRSVRLSGENKRMIWVPAGLAHGFRVVSETAHVVYKATDFYAAGDEHTIVWNDAGLGIDWELEGEPLVSAKDAKGVSFRDADTFE
jgi:dTDP-4-dehydrorhamnose 3,5-epimerase